MWTLNYDSIPKFLVSVGAGLLLAGFFLGITNLTFLQERIVSSEFKMVDVINLNTSDVQRNLSLDLLRNQSDRALLQSDKIAGMAQAIVVFGAILFFIGFILWFVGWKSTK